MQLGAIIGLVLGVIGFFAMRKLATRVELDETKTALRLAAIVDLALFPVLGAFVGGLTMGD
ncbi:MAG: hypothetical protein WBF87_14070 [Mesorhizobium sp.]